MTQLHTAEPTLKRGLASRHLQLIAIGGAIGTGLFLGSGKVITLSGPSILLVYAIIGTMVFFILRALGELLLSNLHFNSFADIAKHYVGPWAGFFVAWNYWITWVLVGVADVIAVSTYVKFFNPDIPAWAVAAAVGLLLLILNLQPVRWFGESEFWFAIVKVVAVLSLIIVGLWLILSGFTSPEGVQARFSNIWTNGGFFPLGLSGFLLGFQMAFFSFMGTELVGTLAAETRDPRASIPRAINAVPIRLALFYVGALAIIMSVTPWNVIDPSQSPFVSMFAFAGFGFAAILVNLVVITSATSSANAGMFSASRMALGLAGDGHAPRALSIINERGVPRKAVFFTCLFLFTAVPLTLAESLLSAFTFVASIASTFHIFTWGMIVVSYIVYRRKQPASHASSHYRLPFAAVTPWIVLVFFVFMIGVLLYGDDTRISILLAPLWYVLLGVAWSLRKKQLLRQQRPITRSIPTTAHPLDHQSEHQN